MRDEEWPRHGRAEYDQRRLVFIADQHPVVFARRQLVVFFVDTAFERDQSGKGRVRRTLVVGLYLCG